MPKIVDPAARRDAVADATLRVIGRVGLEQASLRAIADESGLAIGSVRHYFDNHTELTVFALASLRRRMTARLLPHISAFEASGRAREAAETILSELLPIDQVHRDEAAVWLAFVTAARTRPELQPHAGQLFDGLRMVVSRVLTRLREAGEVSPDRDLRLETERLCSLLDGLTVNALLQPDRLPRRLMLATLARHLDDLR